MSYCADAYRDAKETVDSYLHEIIEQLIDDGEASDDLLNDYPNGDAWHHESHVDRDYDLSEAADLLRDLSRHKETDRGLWEGFEPERAIAAQAAYTYGNAVYSEWRDLIERINDQYGDVQSDLLEIENGCEKRRECIDNGDDIGDLSAMDVTDDELVMLMAGHFGDDVCERLKRERVESFVKGIIS